MLTTRSRAGPAAGSARGHKPAPTLRQQALRALARREYSRIELERKLRGTGQATLELEALLDEFEKSGWLSDQRFATGAARQRSGRYSQRFIVADLKHRGVDGDTARDAVTALDQDDYASACALWLQRFGAAPTDQKQKARQVRFLQSRGFPLGVIFKVLRDQGVDPDEE